MSTTFGTHLRRAFGTQPILRQGNQLSQQLLVAFLLAFVRRHLVTFSSVWFLESVLELNFALKNSTTDVFLLSLSPLSHQVINAPLQS